MEMYVIDYFIVNTNIIFFVQPQNVFDENSDSTSLRERLTEFIRLIYYKYVKH